MSKRKQQSPSKRQPNSHHLSAPGCSSSAAEAGNQDTTALGGSGNNAGIAALIQQPEVSIQHSGALVEQSEALTEQSEALVQEPEALVRHPEKLIQQLFNDNLHNCRFYLKVVPRQRARSELHLFEIVQFTITPVQGTKAHLSAPVDELLDCEEFWLYVGNDGQSSMVYFEKGQAEVVAGKKNKRKVEKLGFWSVDVDLPQPCLEALHSSLSQTLPLVLETVDMATQIMVVSVQATELLVPKLPYPSFPRGKKAANSAFMVFMQHIYQQRLPFDFEGLQSTKKHDVDTFYEELQGYQRTVEVTANVQHDSMLPRLRPYQCQAVQWMLDRETADCKTEEVLHPLYTEVVLKSGQTIYYNAISGIACLQRPTPMEGMKGGILADEMGLGKTLEVLAVMQLNPRPPLRPPSPLPVMELPEEDEPEQNEVSEEAAAAVVETEKKPKRRRKNKKASKEGGEKTAEDGGSPKPSTSSCPDSGANAQSSGTGTKRKKRKSRASEATEDGVAPSNSSSDKKEKSTGRKRRKKTSQGKDEVSTSTLDSKEGDAEVSTSLQLESSTCGSTSETKAPEAMEVEANIVCSSTSSEVEANTAGNELGSAEASSVAHVEMSCDDRDIPMEGVSEAQPPSSQDAAMAVCSDHSYFKADLPFSTDIETSQPSASHEGMETDSPRGERDSQDRSDTTLLPETLEDKSSRTSSCDSVGKRGSVDSSSDQDSATSRTGESRTLSDMSELPVIGEPHWSDIKTKPERSATLAALGFSFDSRDAFECPCGKGLENGPRSMPVQCNNCGLRQHATCVNYDLTDPHRGHYLCPHCHYHTPAIPSKATLIISPESICYQWAEEIKKHIKQSSMKVLIYGGVGGRNGYIQPQKLASQDVVITTYEKLSKEINFVDLPHSNCQQGRKFRQPKRFMATPSPIVAVEWWRVCLDEAQMVECTSTKTAEMARRLSAVHRWCVTGTPITKSLEDLFGLMAFLGTDPYCIQTWFRKLLFEPYCHGIRQPLYHAVSGVLRRTAKKDVLDQIGLPGQTEELHALIFSPVEAHFYARKYDDTRTNALRLLQNLPDKNATLNSLDRKTLSKLLQPLRTLRLVCCHPQAVRGEFLSLHKQTMTMEQLLEAMVTKAKLECEAAHRNTIFSINGIAGIHIVFEEYIEAAEVYRSALRLMIEKEGEVRTDKMQQLHAMHNLHWLLTNHPHGIPPTLRDSQLPQQCEDVKAEFLAKYAAQVQASRDVLQPLMDTATQLQSQLREDKDRAWWLELLAVIQHREGGVEELFRLLSLELENIAFSAALHHIQRCRTLDGLKMVIDHNLNELEAAEEAAVNGVLGLTSPPTAATLEIVAPCCIRPAVFGRPANTCEYCVVKTLIEKYAVLLFRTEQESSHGGAMYASCAVEETLRVILGYGQRLRASREALENGSCYLKLMETRRKAYIPLNALWRELWHEVCGLDQMEQAMTRMRLKEKWEDTTNSGNVLNSHLEAAAHRESLLSLKENSAKNFLTAQGRLRYLEHLKKKSETLNEGEENTELCPICQNTLGNRWCVLQCCHALCLACLDYMLKQNPQARRLCCAMCRTLTPHVELAYVSMRSEEDTSSVQVKGSSSTKITAVVRTLLQIKQADPQAKSLVFSNWPDMLELISVALKENDLKFCSLANSCPKKFRASLNMFRDRDDVNILLLPVSTGSRGLNLTHATHVLLVEPLLDPSIELQAVSRVHRIGQLRETFVHRFVVQGTIEERIYKLSSNVKASTSLPSSEVENLKIDDLINLYGRLEVTPEDGNEEGQVPELSAGGGHRLGTSTSMDQSSFPATSMSQTSGPSTSMSQSSGPSTSMGHSSFPATSMSQTSGPSTSMGQSSFPTTSMGHRLGTSASIGQSSGPSTSMGHRLGTSAGMGQSLGPSTSMGQSSGPSTSMGQSSGPTTTMGQSSGTSTSMSESSGPSTSMSESSGPSTSMDHSSGPSTSMSQSSGPSTSMGYRLGP